MASQLSTRDKRLLNAYQQKKVGLEPYEDGLWGEQENRDFAFFELFDENRNLIQFKNLPLSNFNVVNTDIHFYPGNHIRSLGYQSGKFVVRYTFLRKMAGDENSVLVHTSDRVDTKVGDVYTDVSRVYLRDDGIIFATTEDEYNTSPDTAEQLGIEDLKYQVDAVSSDRTEVRLKAKKINGSYTDQFLDIQTSIKEVNIDGSTIGFRVDDNLNVPGSPVDSMQLEIVSGDFRFTNQMKSGTITLPNCYTVNQISVPVKTGVNFLQNPNGEMLEYDSYSNVIKLGDAHEWDSTLHGDAVKPQNWTDGFLPQAGTAWEQVPHVGYHAHWVQNEGVSGGVCMKFPDINEPFAESETAGWPSNLPSRGLRIEQQMTNLLGQGVKHFDVVNISMDVKSTADDKGVQLSLYYPYGIQQENEPPGPGFGVLEGWYDPNGDPSPQNPPNNPPSEYVPNTPVEASQVEPKPPGDAADLLSQYGASLSAADLLTFSVGNTTEEVLPNGLGAWKIFDITYDSFNDNIRGSTTTTGAVNYIDWRPDVGNDAVGALSEAPVENLFVWNGNQWVDNGGGNNSPIAPAGTVDNPSAINYHPQAEWNQDVTARSHYRRTTAQGQNLGWQTGTTRGGENADLFKDDLVWTTKYGYNTDNQEIVLRTIEEWSESSIFRIRKVLGTDDGIERDLFDDIFENGRITSVTRVRKIQASAGVGTIVEIDYYYIFYNDGRGHERSNKFFQMKKGDGSFKVVQGSSRANIEGVSYIKDLNESFNDELLEAGGNMEVTFKRNGTSLNYFFILAGRVHTLTDNTGDIRNSDFDSNDTSPGDISSYFSITQTPDVMFPRSSAAVNWTNFTAIIGDQVYKHKNDTLAGFDSIQNLDTVFYNCGVVMNFQNGHQPVTFGVRNPGATNYGIQDEDGNVIDSTKSPIYDNGTSILDYDVNPLKIGVESPEGLWIWDGYQWRSQSQSPPRYDYHATAEVKALAKPSQPGIWENVSVEIPIPSDWVLDQKWWLQIDGNQAGGSNQGIVYVDNMYMDFTLKDQSETIPVQRPYTAQITDVSSDGLFINVDRTFKEKAELIGVEDQNSETTVFDISDPGVFDSFKVTHLINNPKDFRTYLKFDNQLFLTTNFKQDRTNVNVFPYSVVYKLYEPLPTTVVSLDECTIVKEMSDVLEEKVQIIDFIPEEEPDLVLRSPDLSNVESPVQRRTTPYRNETEILTDDTSISNELRNSYLSQSLDSVEINTDYSRYENFVNFSSVEARIRNFKKKLENIEEHKISSASYIGVSGSSSDLNTYHYKIEDIKNNFDSFEKYMYHESSSYASSSLGVFYDNAWPKISGDGSFGTSYVLAHTTSSQADTWFSNAMTSASNYDLDNSSKLSNVMPEFIVEDFSNAEYVRFIDMIGQHFDHIWEYINSMTDTFDRRERVDEGISKDLLWNVAKSLGWKLHDGKDLIDLPRYFIGKEVTGSAYSDYSSVAERDVSREIWSRIINNMPFFLKNKGTVKALKGLINIYGIPSTILRVKEYGGPNLPDDATPQFEITRKFTKALDFRGGQYVKTNWANDSSTSRKPDTIEFRFKAATGSNQILVQKEDGNNQDFFIRLKDNSSTDNYGYVSFMLSGSKVGIDQGEYKEVLSSELPIYDGDFYSVMVRRVSGSSNTSVSQSYELHVGKYDSGRSKIHLYSKSTMDVTQAASSSFSNAWTGSGDIYIGGQAAVSGVGARFSGSIMEYRHWTETLNTGSFRNHIANPKAYDGNSVSSSYENLVLRYSMNDNKDLSSDTDGIRDVSSNQTTTISGSHNGFTGNFFSNVVDELKSHIPNIGALRRSTNKVRIEENKMKPGFNLSPHHRATDSVYDTSPNDSNKVGIWFSPTDVINNDIINSVGDLNFDNYLGDPRDREELDYRGLGYVANNYWKKYTAPNNFWDYIRMIKYYDQSLFPQLRKLIPARAKADIGVIIEPNIFERPKVTIGKTPKFENKFYSSSIDVTKDITIVTGSYNHGSVVTDYEAYDGNIGVFSYQEEISGSSFISASGENLLKVATGSEVRDSFMDLSIWQRLNTNDEYYSDVTMSFGAGAGDTIEGVKKVIMPVITGSRVYGINQRTINVYTSSADAKALNPNSSSFKNTDLDNFSHLFQGLRNSFYEGVKNTGKTTSDGREPIEVIISAPTKLVTTDEGGSPLTTGDGIVPDFKDPDKPKLVTAIEEKGLKDFKKKAETDEDRAKARKLDSVKKEFQKQKQIDTLKEVGKNTNSSSGDKELEK